VSRLVRGRVIWFQLGDIGRKPAVVLSNDARNRALGSALVARITTSNKPALPSIVELSGDDPVKGRVLCDDLIEIYDEEVLKDAGELSRPSMRSVEEGVLHALGIIWAISRPTN
jgi:mRNA interferase MazF